jgi:hypothetical protein
MTEAISMRTRDLYMGGVSPDDLEEEKRLLLQKLDQWKQQVEAGQIISILMVGIGPDFACRTYCGADGNLPNIVQLGAVHYLVADVETRIYIRRDGAS